MDETLQTEKQLYPSRSGERIEAYLSILSRDPETPLDSEERHQVLVFESALMEGYYTTRDGDELRAHEERPIEQVLDEAKYLASRHEMTAEYFLTPDGRAAATEVSVVVDASITTPAQVLDFIRTVVSSTERKSLSALAKQSREWATIQMVNDMASGIETPDYTRAMVFDDTAKLRNALQAFQAYRDLCMKARRDLHKRHGSDDLIVQAKRDITNLYLKVINGKLAEYYPDMLWAWDQANATNDEYTKRDLREAWPAGEVFASTRPEVRRFYIEALDHLRNGTTYEDGQPTAINQELRDLFDGATADLHEQKEVLGGRFTPEEHQRLSEIIFDAEGMQAFCKDILAELCLLSSEPDATYVKDRVHRAADGKWQVIVRPEISAMGAEDPEGVLEIPANFKRTLTKATAPVGVVPGAAHEIAHIYQLDNAQENRGSLRLAGRMRGRSSLVLREAGSVRVEHLVQKELFGAERPDSPHYMRAMEVIEDGGGEKQAIRAFYDSYRAANPDESHEECVRVAESRVMRLCRRYGGYNSQPLNYAQTAAFVVASDSMNEHQRALVFAEGAFDLPDMVTLHRYGLLSEGVKQFPTSQFCDIVERRLRNILEK